MKSNVPPTPVKYVGSMALTRTVPALVPFDFHRVRLAEKYSFPPTAVRYEGADDKGWERPWPGLMSLTMTVPRLVPFDVHSSRPWVPSLAAKNNLRPAAARELGPWLSPVAGLMSLTRTVAALVPFDVHSSRPWVPSSATKNSLRPTAVNEER